MRRVVKTVHISSLIPDLANGLTKRCPHVKFVNVPVGCSGGKQENTIFNPRKPNPKIWLKVLTPIPGIVNRTFENRTQSNSIRGLSSIEFGNRTKSNTTTSVSSISVQIEFNRTNRTQSNSIELNPSDCVRLSSETELNRTQLNGFRSIGSGEPIQSKPVKARFSCASFTIYSITRTPFINCPRQLRQQNRTKQSYHYSHGRISKLSYPFLFQ